MKYKILLALTTLTIFALFLVYKMSKRDLGINKKEELSTMTKVLVVYHSKTRNTFEMAKIIADAARSYPGVIVDLKEIKSIDQPFDKSFVHIDELSRYDGIAFGAPVYFSGMSADLKYFLDQSLTLWKEKTLSGKPAAIFMSAGSGHCEELATQSISSVLNSHEMIILPSYSDLEKIKALEKQGYELARVASLLKIKQFKDKVNTTFFEPLKLPVAPKAVGKYKPYKISGNLIYINQISLLNNKVLLPGKIIKDLTLEEAQKAAEQTSLNILAVLKDALGGDLSRVEQVVQLTGYFNTLDSFKGHSGILNSASNIMIEFFKERGEHTRAAFGVNSLPLDSSNEIQAIFEIR